jgi:hypothetical protein
LLTAKILYIILNPDKNFENQELEIPLLLTLGANVYFCLEEKVLIKIIYKTYTQKPSEK